MNGYWRQATAWFSIHTVAAMLCALLLVQGVSAQTAEQSIDLSSQSGDVTINSGGIWMVSGDLQGGIIVDAGADDITLVLDGVNIANDDGPAIAFVSAGEITVQTTAGSENYVADGGTNEMDAAIWADANITFTGEGLLDISAVNEGIETTADIVIDGGTILVHATDDGLNANTDGTSQITINGGTLFVETTAGDGIDSNGGIEINGGTVVSYGALVDGNSGLDADGPVVINGGIVVASGGPMAMIDGSSTQAVIWATGNGNIPAGTGVVIMNGHEVVIAVQPVTEVQSLIISAPDLDPAAANELFLGGTFEVDATSLATGAVTDAGTAGGTLSETNPGGMRNRP